MKRHTIPAAPGLYPVILRPGEGSGALAHYDVAQRYDPRAMSYNTFLLGSVQQWSRRNWIAQRYSGARAAFDTKREAVDWLRTIL